MSRCVNCGCADAKILLVGKSFCLVCARREAFARQEADRMIHPSKVKHVGNKFRGTRGIYV